jgi:hypothetical protein
VDRQYLSAWSLANYYFRRGDQTNFWQWSRQAARLCYGDLIPLVKLCDRIAPDRMLSGLADLGTDSSKIDGAYLNVLIEDRRWGDAQIVARRILARGDRNNTGRLVAFINRQMEAGNADAAREIWDGLFPEPTVNGQTVTNRNFRTKPSGQGFDWATSASPGIHFDWREARIRWFLGGSQPETCVLLEQPLILQPRSYYFHFAYSIPTRRPGSPGLHWAIDSRTWRAESPALLASEGLRNGEWRFRARAKGLARLLLLYRREPGSMPAELQVELHHVWMEPQ